MVDPMTRARFPISFPISIWRLPATLGGHDADPALLRKDVEIAIEIGATDHVQHDINAPVCREPLDLGHEIRLPVVDGTLLLRSRRKLSLSRRFRRSQTAMAPTCRLTMMAMLPIPLVPPWISTVSPAFNPARVTRLS